MYILANAVVGSGFGFAFWMLAAKLYSAGDVGIATAAVSAMSLLVLLSRLGLDYSLIRFFPQNDKNRIFNTAYAITTAAAIISCLLFILGIDIFSPALVLLKDPANAVLFIVFLAASSTIQLTGSAFVALRKTHRYFLQSLLCGSRVVFVFLLTAFGAMGVFGAMGAAFVLTAAASLLWLTREGIRLNAAVDTKFLRESMRFSAGNYLTSLFVTAPAHILPLVVLNVLGADSAAYYYVAFSIAALLFTIPAAVSTSLLVEGSHEEELPKIIKKSLLLTAALLLPAAAATYVLSGWLLAFIGQGYSAEGSVLLQTLAAASILVAVNTVYLSVLRIRKKVAGLTVLSGITSVSLIIFSYVLMPHAGLAGIGYAWAAAYGVGAAIIALKVLRSLGQPLRA